MLIFAIIFAIGAVISFVLRGALTQLGYDIPGIFSYAFFRLLCIVYLWAVFCTLAIVQVLSIRLTDEGIHGRTFWGRPCFFVWSEIVTARKTGLWPLYFIIVLSSDSDAALWFPLFLKRRDDLRRQIAEYTEEFNPLRATLVQ